MAQPAHLEQTIAKHIEFTGWDFICRCAGQDAFAAGLCRIWHRLPSHRPSTTLRSQPLDAMSPRSATPPVLMRQETACSFRQPSTCSRRFYFGMGSRQRHVVEIDNLELLILDGSALPYVEAFLSVYPHQGAAFRKRERPSGVLASPLKFARAISLSACTRDQATVSNTPSISPRYRPAEGLRRPGC